MLLISANIEDLRCPICLEKLSYDFSSKLIICGEGHKFDIKDEIPIFSKDPDLSYGEIPEIEMGLLLNELRGPAKFEEKFVNYLKLKSEQFQDQLLRYIFDYRRSAFSFILPSSTC